MLMIKPRISSFLKLMSRPPHRLQMNPFQRNGLEIQPVAIDWWVSHGWVIFFDSVFMMTENCPTSSKPCIITQRVLEMLKLV